MTQMNPQQVLFLDMSVGGKSLTNTPIASVEELRSKLLHLSNEDPRFVEFKSYCEDRLQLGIGGPFACAQFLNRDNLPPYLCAKAPTVRAKDDIEFNCGGTPTPIPPELCISFEEALKIAEYFFEKGARDPSFEWIEV